MAPAYEDLSKEELLRTLRLLQSEPRLRVGGPETERLIHDLQVHQIELEMQNRELREAQQRLEDSRSRYADLYDFAPVGYCTLNQNSKILEANLTAATLFGMERASLLGSMLISLVPPQQRTHLLAHLRTCFRQRTRAMDDLRLSSKASGPLVLQLVSMPVLGPEGEVFACKTAMTDISLIKRSEQRFRLLATISEVLTASFDYLPNLAQVVRLAVPDLADICLLDVLEENRQIHRVEVAFADSEKRRLAEAIKRHAPSYEGSTPQAQVLRSGQPILLSDSTPEALSGASAEGLIAVFNARSLMFVPLASAGRMLGVFTFAMSDSGRRYLPNDLAFVQDLASRAAMAIDNARLYEEAQKAIRARQDILSIVCHDLRNPLSTITLGTSALIDSSPQPDRRQARRQLEVMRRGARQMERMITDLLDVSSIEAGRLSIDLGEHSLNKLINDAFEMLLPLAREKKLLLRLQVPSREASVMCDRERVLQVFGNLGGNAIKFTPEGASITIGAQVHDRVARFAVEDNGPGISEQVLRNLFHRYWQARETAKQGRGLGLFISKGIVEAQGGRIWVQSHPTQGSSFFFTLPLAKQRGRQTTRPEPARPLLASVDLASGMIVVVDDDPDVREMLTYALTERGYQVVAMAGGEEALAYLKNSPSPRLILLDLVMPDMDGWKFLAERNRDPALSRVPVIVLSAQPDVAERVAACNALYVKKPVVPENLVQTMEHVAH
jgi:PAS domain S-box-containing protein